MSQAITTTSPGLILGVCGASSSGKTTIGEYLSREHGFTHLDLTGDTGPAAAPDSDLALERVRRLSELLKPALEAGGDIILTGLHHREEGRMLHDLGGRIIMVMKPQISGESIFLDADHLLLNDCGVDNLCDNTQRLLKEIRDDI